MDDVDADATFKPTGFEWGESRVEESRTRGFILCDGANRSSLRGWICYQHPDGQWVTLRKATKRDLGALFVTADAFQHSARHWIPELSREAPNDG